LALGQPNWFMKFGMTCAAAAAAGQALGGSRKQAEQWRQLALTRWKWMPS